MLQKPLMGSQLKKRPRHGDRPRAWYDVTRANGQNLTENETVL